MESSKVICASCGEPVKGDLFYGDKGTPFENKPVCEVCWESAEVCAVVYYNDDEEPCQITDFTNETEGDFRVRWHPIDPWRGHFEAESDRYVKVFDDAILSGHESAGMLKKLNDLVVESLLENRIEFARVFCCSSNAFATYFEIWVRNSTENILKAVAVIEEAKRLVDFHNPIYSTGIITPRKNLEILRKLGFNVRTDADLARLIAREGDKFIDELLRRLRG